MSGNGTDTKYIALARKYGVNVEDPTTLHYLINALRYCEARFKLLKNDRAQLVEDLGLKNSDELEYLRNNKYLDVAGKIVGEVVMQEVLDTDMRNVLMKEHHDDYLDMYRNIRRIAKGEAHPVTGKTPPEREQVAAFTALMNTKVNDAFETMLFLPDAADSPETKYLQTHKQLQASEDVIDLDSKPAP
jgi:hypothetical protein